MRNLAIVLILCGLYSLCGCGRSTPSNFYMLESSLNSIRTNNLPQTTLRIAAIDTPAYLSRNNIVSRVNGETRLILAEFHLWAEPVGNGVHRIIEETLTGPLLENGITVLPVSSESRSDYTLIIDLQRLDGNFNEKAAFECQWTLLNRDDRAINRGIYSNSEQVAGADYNILVKAESELVKNFGQYLADQLPVLIGKKNRKK